MYKDPADAAAAGQALTFFAWAYKDGAAMAAELDYVPLPASLIAQVEATWKSGIMSGGHPVWTGPVGTGK
jgi:phosphate transport system substrate-binding protein